VCSSDLLLQHSVALLLVAKIQKNPKDFAAGGKGATVRSLVTVQRLHELDLCLRIVPFTGGGVNPSPQPFGRSHRSRLQLLQLTPILPLFPRPAASLSYWYDHPPTPPYPKPNRILPTHHRKGTVFLDAVENVAITQSLRMRESKRNR